MSFRFCDEDEDGSWFGWAAEGRIPRTSHALAVESRVWLVDPVAWPAAEERARALGTPAGVIQLLDRHNRDCADIASRLGVPHHRLPERVDAPLELVRVINLPVWHELALWWPAQRVLVVAEALGTIRGYFTLGDETIGIHPLLRLFPPKQLARLDPEVVLVGHGDGIRNASEPFRRAFTAPARRVLRLPRKLRGTGG